MRVVIDTNVLISALLSDRSPPARLVDLWRSGRFDLLASAEQVDELMRVTRYPKIRERLTPAVAGRLVNDLRGVAIVVSNLPALEACEDPSDDYLLATAQRGAADYLVTGDKRHLLTLGTYRRTRIVTVRDFLETIG